MVVRASEIGDVLRKEIAGFDQPMTVTNVGTVVDVGDGIAQVYGLSGVGANELVEFSKDGTIGLAFNLGEDSVGVIVLGEYTQIEEGDEVRTTGRIASVPVGDALLGRVVDALGRPVDGKGPIQTDKTRPIERIAPGVIARQDVDTPLQTGITSIDSMIPVGRGQRELIIGDRQVGKSAVAIDTIINQRDEGVFCIYVAIGQKRAQVAQVVRTLEQYDAMNNTIVVMASASDPAGMQWISAYAGTSMGEEFMETGRDALIIYDDLTKHAAAYREVSLLNRRPPGREAYPGDVFYLHSRLLERSARLSEANGGGSLTSLPIIETQAGDVSTYIPTNVISITDGQIFLETDLFFAGIRPAINPGISVSRVGSAAQIRAMRKVTGSLRLDLAAYRSLQAFAQFGTSDLDAATRRQLERGQRMTELLKQRQYQPYNVAEEVASLWMGGNDYLSDIKVEDVVPFRDQYLEYLRNSRSDVLDLIREKRDLTDDVVAALKDATDTFKSNSTFDRVEQ